MSPDRVREPSSAPAPARSVPAGPSPSSASVFTLPLPDGLTIAEAAARLTVDQAVRAENRVQADLVAGRLHTPYPPKVARTLHICEAVFIAYCDAHPEQAAALVARLA